ncbi:MAG: glycosyltransferase family 61 protein [Methylocystis sp.]
MTLTNARSYKFIDAVPPFSSILDETCAYAGLLSTDQFDNEAYLSEFYRRCHHSQPVGAYVLEDSVVSDAWMLVSSPDFREVLSRLPGMGWADQHIEAVLRSPCLTELQNGKISPDYLQGKYVLLSFPGIFTYGHVLVDVSIRIQLAKAMGVCCDAKFLIQSPVHAWFLPFLAIAGISIEDCVTIANGQSFRVEKLIVPTITGLNGVLSKNLAQYAFRRMKETMANILGVPAARETLIFPLHTTVSSLHDPRCVAQRETIVEILLRQFGIEAFDPLNLSFIQQVEKFRNARLVVGEDSSALHNILWSDRADIAVMAPKGLFNYYHIGIQSVNGGRCAIHWGDRISQNENAGRFQIDLDSFCRTIEKLLREEIPA